MKLGPALMDPNLIRAEAKIDLDKLKGTSEKDALREVAKEFESMFFEQVFKNMRKSFEDRDEEQDNYFSKGYGGKVFEGMLDTEYSKVLGQQGTLGLADIIVKQYYGEGQKEGKSLDWYQDRPMPAIPTVPGHNHEGTDKNIAAIPCMPVSGPISSGFGMRIHPISGQHKMHKGIDIAIPVGTKVNSSMDGVVKFSGNLKHYGNTIIIKHQNGFETVYAHLDKAMVTKGQRVFKDQEIATSGNTGRSTGPHLHFEVRKNGDAINPLEFFSK